MWEKAYSFKPFVVWWCKYVAKNVQRKKEGDSSHDDKFVSIVLHRITSTNSSYLYALRVSWQMNKDDLQKQTTFCTLSIPFRKSKWMIIGLGSWGWIDINKTLVFKGYPIDTWQALYIELDDSYIYGHSTTKGFTWRKRAGERWKPALVILCKVSCLPLMFQQLVVFSYILKVLCLELSRAIYMAFFKE